MSVLVTNERRHAIQEAITEVYNTADIVPAFGIPRIVPLDSLITAYPIRPVEVSNLTRRHAAQELAAKSGQIISVSDESADWPLAGFVYAWPFRHSVQACLFVEQYDIIERRRFSAAHELGHYMLHFRPAIRTAQEQGRRLTMLEGLSYAFDGDDANGAFPEGTLGYSSDGELDYAELLEDIPRIEAEANQFAAELLMPEEGCRFLVQKFEGRASARRLAAEFLVSVAAMRWRLEELGLN